MIRAVALPLQLLRPEPWLVIRFAVGSLGRAALTAASILLIREFLAGALGESGGLAGWAADAFGAPSVLWVTVVLLLMAHLGATALTYDSQVTQQRMVKVIELGIMERLIRHLLELSVGFFDRRSQGDLIQIVRQDVTQMRIAALATGTIVLEALQAGFLVAAAAYLSPPLALWAFILVPLSLLPIYVIARRTLARGFVVRRKGVKLFDYLLQLVRGIRIIKIYQGQQIEAERTVGEARQYFDELVTMERIRALATVVLQSLAGLSLVAVIVVGGFQVMNGSLGWPELLAFLMAARAAQGPLNNVNSAYMEIQRYGASVAHIEALLGQRPELVDRTGARRLAGVSTVSAAQVSFDVGGQRILEDISFHVEAGETLGVVGPSGAGKTTLLSLVARFYDPVSGAICFDGVDLRDYRIADVHGMMAIVTQDPFLFATSIRENIRCGRPSATDEDVEIAARAAEIHDEILAMPDGYETAVGHGGRELSRGEAQRVNIARAILKNAPVLLLDEATSSLDSYAETRVQRAIDRLVEGRLVISVAHRLSTLRNASRILVIEDGRAVGLGTHTELLAECRTYRRLWEAQALYESASPSGEYGEHEIRTPDLEDEPPVRQSQVSGL